MFIVHRIAALCHQSDSHDPLGKHVSESQKRRCGHRRVLARESEWQGAYEASISFPFLTCILLKLQGPRTDERSESQDLSEEEQGSLDCHVSIEHLC